MFLNTRIIDMIRNLLFKRLVLALTLTTCLVPAFAQDGMAITVEEAVGNAEARVRAAEQAFKEAEEPLEGLEIAYIAARKEWELAKQAVALAAAQISETYKGRDTSAFSLIRNIPIQVSGRRSWELIPRSWM